MTCRLESETVSKIIFKYGNKKNNKFLVYLAIPFYPYFLNIFIKMGEIGPLVERSGCWNLQLPNILMNTFESKQHYDVPCAISCQGTFIMELK